MLLNLHSPWVYEERWTIDNETMQLLDKTYKLVFERKGWKFNDVLKDHQLVTVKERKYNIVPDDKLKNYKNAHKEIEKSNISDELKYNRYIDISNIFICDIEDYAEDAPFNATINFYRSKNSTSIEKQMHISGSYACMIVNAKIELQKGEYAYATINAYDDTTNDFTYRLTEISTNPDTALPEETSYIYKRGVGRDVLCI